MTQTPTPSLTTTDRFGLELPGFQDRVDVRVLTAALAKLNTYAAHLNLANTFTANQTIQGVLTVSGAASVGGNFTVGGQSTVTGQFNAGSVTTVDLTATRHVNVGGNLAVTGALNVGGHTTLSTASIGGLPNTTWSWWNNMHRFSGGNGIYSDSSVIAVGRLVTNNWDVGTANSLGGALDVASTVTVHGGTIYMEGSRVVMMQWRGDLGAIYFPYGNGIYAEGTSSFAAIASRGAISAGGTISTPAHLDARGLFMPTAAVGDTPVYVLAQNGSGWANWYPKARFSSARLWAGKVSGFMGTNLTINVPALGWNSDAPTFPLTGWYAIFLTGAYNSAVGSANCGLNVYVGGAHVASIQWGINNGFGQGAIGWWGYCVAGQALVLGSWGPGATGEHPDQQFVVAYLGETREGW